MSQQYGLGRGLASLIPSKKDVIAGGASVVAPSFASDLVAASPVFAEEAKRNMVREVLINLVAPNPHQPRLHFDETKLQELAQSIKEHGILQPLVVTASGNGFELIAGERRLQAAKLSGLERVPVIVREAGEQEKLELAVIENVQRHNLNPIEEAKAYRRLADEFSLSQEEVSRKMGKNRSTVANTLRLLELPVEIQRAVAEGRLSEGHAKALLSIGNPEKQRALFELIIKEEWTVRETEEKAREVSVRPHMRRVRDIDPSLLAKEESLREQLGTKVRITPSGKGGRVVIEYYSDEELESLLSRF